MLFLQYFCIHHSKRDNPENPVSISAPDRCKAHVMYRRMNTISVFYPCFAQLSPDNSSLGNKVVTNTIEENILQFYVNDKLIL